MVLIECFGRRSEAVRATFWFWLIAFHWRVLEAVCLDGSFSILTGFSFVASL